VRAQPRVGFELPGGYAQYFLTRAAQLHPLPDHLPLDAATLLEPMAVVLHGLARLNATHSDSALVVGDGPIGLLHRAGAPRARGATLALVGGRQQKLALAQTFGAAQTFTYRMPLADLQAALNAVAPEGFALAVEASGKVSGFDLALNQMAKYSELLLFGDYGPAHASVPLLHLIHREVRITASNCGTGAWDAAVEFFGHHVEQDGARSAAREMSRMITHRFSPRRFMEALDAAERRRDEAVKVLLDWTAL